MAERKNLTVVSAVEFKRHFGRYREEAQRRPVGITNHGRISAVLISAAEYEELLRLKETQPQSAYVWELPDDVIEDIVHGETPEEAHEAERALGQPRLARAN